MITYLSSSVQDLQPAQEPTCIPLADATLENKDRDENFEHIERAYDDNAERAKIKVRVENWLATVSNDTDRSIE